MELSSLDCSMASCLPSVRAAASLLVAKLVLSSCDQREKIIRDVANICSHPFLGDAATGVARALLTTPTSTYQAIPDKYKAAEFGSISKNVVLQGNAQLKQLAKLEPSLNSKDKFDNQIDRHELGREQSSVCPKA